MKPSPLLVLGAVAVTALAAPCRAQEDVLERAAIHSEPQYYLLSVPPTPVEEVADIVLGEALGLTYEIDPEVEGLVALNIDGRLSPTALVRAFASRLWEANVALVEDPSGALRLIPREQTSRALTQGDRPLAPEAAMAARTSQAAARPERVEAGVADRPARPSTPWLVWLGLGLASGAALSWALGRAPHQTVPTPPALPAPDPAPVVETPAVGAESDELTIPVFFDRRT